MSPNFEKTLNALDAKLTALPGQTAAPPGRLLRLEQPAPPVDALAWLAGQGHLPRYYWADRDTPFLMAGVGEADCLSPEGPIAYPALFAALRNHLGKAPESLRYYGGFRFHFGAVKGARWKAFRNCRFVIPRLEFMRKENGSCILAANLFPRKELSLAAEIDAVRRLLNRLAPAAPEPTPVPRPLARTDQPQKALWKNQIAAILAAIEAGAMSKVVLARESTFQAAAPFNAVDLLRGLLEENIGTYAFCFQPAPDRAFIGAPPERLYHRQGATLATEALAGTRPRGASIEEDKALGHALLESKKEQHEHHLVVDMLRRQLTRLCYDTQGAASPALLKLRHCQHLRTPLWGRLRDGVTDAELIDALHPTPAVGGAPRAAALEWIAQNEAFDRGIYAAPVGWVSAQGAEFSVAIRSGLVQGDALSLYSGAGIVTGADAEEEWAEIETKIKSFLAILDQRP